MNGMEWMEWKINGMEWNGMKSTSDRNGMEFRTSRNV